MKRSTVARLAVAGLLLGISAVFAELSGPPDAVWSQRLNFTLALLFLAAAVYCIVPNLRHNFKKLLPFCKAQLGTYWAVCARCGGHHLGFAVSAATVFLVHQNADLREWVASANPKLLLVLAILFGLPTSLHGTTRRTGRRDPLPHPAVRVITGFLSGLGWFLFFLFFNAVFLK